MPPYTCYRSREPIHVDGVLNGAAWQKAPRSPRFADVVTGEPGLFDTRASLLWDDQNLYIGYWIEEPYPEAHLTARDSLIFLENDAEVFIDGGDTYYEFEINALGTIYEVFYVWKDAYQKGGFAAQPEFDVLKKDAVSFGGNFDRGESFWRGKHPRGLRWAFLDWDFPGLRSAIAIEGKLNDRSTVSRGWTVELAFPWTGMKWLANGRPLPPKDGDVWRLFFARYEKMNFGGNEVHAGWSWDKIGDIDNHAPERWTPIRFSERFVQDL
jgi:hypothetical protein